MHILRNTNKPLALKLESYEQKPEKREAIKKIFPNAEEIQVGDDSFFIASMHCTVEAAAKTVRRQADKLLTLYVFRAKIIDLQSLEIAEDMLLHETDDDMGIVNQGID